MKLKKPFVIESLTKIRNVLSKAHDMGEDTKKKFDNKLKKAIEVISNKD